MLLPLPRARKRMESGRDDCAAMYATRRLGKQYIQSSNRHYTVLTEVEVVESCSSWRGQGRKAQSATREERRGTVRDRRKWKVRVGCRVLGALGDENGGQKSTETSR